MEFNYKAVRTDSKRKTITEYINGFRLYGLEEKNGKFRIEIFHKGYKPFFKGHYDNQEEFEKAFVNEYFILNVADAEKYFKINESNEVNTEMKFISKDGKITAEVRCIQSEKGIYVPINDDGMIADLGRNFIDVESAMKVARNTIRAYDKWGNYVRLSLTRKPKKRLPHEICEIPKLNKKSIGDLKKELCDFIDYFVNEMEKL